VTTRTTSRRARSATPRGPVRKHRSADRATDRRRPGSASRGELAPEPPGRCAHESKHGVRRSARERADVDAVEVAADGVSVPLQRAGAASRAWASRQRIGSGGNALRVDLQVPSRGTVCSADHTPLSCCP
jgi:hypothetical protein